MKIWIKLLVILYFIVFIPPLFVSAHNSIQIHFIRTQDSSGIDGAEFSIIKILDCKNGQYSQAENRKDLNISPKYILQSPKKAAQYLASKYEKVWDYKKTTDAEGRILFQDLSEGVWLVYQSGKAKKAKKHSVAVPVLIQLPQWEDHFYQSDIIIYPKTVLLTDEKKDIEEEENKQKIAEMNQRKLRVRKMVQTGDSKRIIQMMIQLFLASSITIILILIKRRRD